MSNVSLHVFALSDRLNDSPTALEIGKALKADNDRGVSKAELARVMKRQEPQIRRWIKLAENHADA